jgi:hypothetical protein
MANMELSEFINLCPLPQEAYQIRIRQYLAEEIPLRI